MLTGFAFVSIFLGKVGDIIASLLPTTRANTLPRQSDTIRRWLYWKSYRATANQEFSKCFKKLLKKEEGKETTKLYDSFNMGLDEKSCYDHQLAILQQKSDHLIRMLNANQTDIDKWLAKSGDLDGISNSVDVKHGADASWRSSCRPKKRATS
ncbi:hypothetical protein IV203_021715 [Nitzschia inconspicua]|uniref:Uncharacterized protein n=1 Tax=Nitzschia inconspicua TaxID=303405 RepID=A0A9K3PDI9_9STRA|nr:hypothetical protein IV203_021715 [Nitzschia inconspicua]